MSSTANSTALIHRPSNAPITHLENAFGVTSLITAFLRSKLGLSFSEAPLTQNSVQVILNREGHVCYTLSPEYADKLLEKIGIITGILSSIITKDGTYPAPINLPDSIPINNFIRDLADVRKLTPDSFSINPFRQVEAVSVQALEEFLGKVNFVMVQYCKWIYYRTKSIAESGGSVDEEVASILFVPPEVVQEFSTPYDPSNASFKTSNASFF
ncbi:hypothetical protein K435DRAFT_873033 [Dendrothele bispora CBS 962.96]|uniref:Uncharacterized protein n=1 Tax=Dendrothele bispora (strain CBS 962.96) TaxID=1314807 RepID=A0A4S8L1B6_DENBC|nr:hypothetical protein K435DRAFT_873033 [Dendrothele bispora CBS 962.96]